MDLAIREDIYCCSCAEHVVVLDARADKYLLVPERLGPALLRLWNNDSPEERDQVLLQSLISAGIVVTGRPSPSDHLRSIAGTRPNCELTMRDPLRVRWIEAARAAVYQIVSGLGLRRKGLAAVLADLQHNPREVPEAGDSTDERILRVAVAFQAISGLIKQHDKCLPRSIGFVRLCRAKGVKVTLIVGVAMDPFSAHAWVQSGACVLNDSLERVRWFTPIFAV
ncbi:lasso peptide biosynthesis B2 protein [Blastomonas sp. CCH13-E1]|uniref:lasso peptide biosynthesis B2 protein n=1 Tax=Blastomonas sp. CCH13-E1 TaxID=1768739 RepID=UPI0009E7D97C